jgi:uncharacterized protein YdeI (YjbR/CyaY-like superfamily)
MNITEKLYVINRNEWRVWLEKNHKSKKEIWLIYYKKHTGKPRIPYDDAVEEALCFGWIDSTVRKVDEEKYAQKYTPRHSGSIWSQLNIKRAHKMIKEGKMTHVGLALFEEAGKKKSSRIRMMKKKFTVPVDLKKALAKNKNAMNNFDKFAPSYKKMYILWIDDAKKQETRKRRIKRVIEWAAKNKKPGMM